MATHPRSIGQEPADDLSWRTHPARAAARDAALPETDWFALPDRAAIETFAAPSGALASFSLGDPAHERVVLVPGITGSKEDFVLLAPLLADAGYFVQSYDLAGQYESCDAGPAQGKHYDYPLFVGDLIAFLSVGPAAHVIGYSFAGILAESVLVAHPHLVTSLALLTTPPLAGDAFRGVRWIGQLSRFASARIAASLMIWGIVTNKNRVPRHRLEFVRARFGKTRRSSVDDAIGLMKHTPDLRQQLAAATQPLLVAVGDHDLWPLRSHTRFAEQIGASLAVYRTGHSPCETAPHQLAADLLRLFARSRS